MNGSDNEHLAEHVEPPPATLDIIEESGQKPEPPPATPTTTEKGK